MLRQQGAEHSGMRVFFFFFFFFQPGAQHSGMSSADLPQARHKSFAA